ncbi:hypothetical protein [Paenibacillus thermotolerans]|uniref:hypothetical protein n=1 Tax=Paenibacillus thermotolerans TaxID=3027807 RepID=UPI002367ECA6|nr:MULTISPECIES: hypothetical protein [unclassified Paenibacillus]
MMLWEHFDKNEWFVLIMLVISYALVFFLPRRLPRSWMILSLVWGFASSTLFDFTIGGGLLDYYRVNDSDRYELTDLLTYFVFAPFGYIFIYVYELLKINKRNFVYYVIGWAVVGVAVQKVSEWMGITHYQHGYRLEYNFAVFLAVQTVSALFYEYVKSSNVRVTRM